MQIFCTDYFTKIKFITFHQKDEDGTNRQLYAVSNLIGFRRNVERWPNYGDKSFIHSFSSFTM